VPAAQLGSNKLHLLAADRAVPATETPLEVPKERAVLAERVGINAKEVSHTEGASPVLNQFPNATYVLPIQFRALATQPGSASPPQPLTFEAVVFVLNGLRFHEAAHRFEAQLAIGLRNPASHTDRSILGEAVKVLIRANADDVTPTEVAIDRLGDPQLVRIGAVAPATPFMVSARTLLDDGDSIEVPIERPALKIEPAKPVIEGWGLAKTVIQIQGSGLTDPSKISIALSSTRGQISPTPVVLGADGRATAELRSDGTGAATVSASGNPFSLGSTSVDFATPYRFLIASLIGAIVGWIARTRARSRSWRSIVVALASSAILAAAYAIGIRWFEWAPDATAGEALAFFVAAIGAYTGLKALKLT
jgi:hypothetical protein